MEQSIIKYYAAIDVLWYYFYLEDIQIDRENFLVIILIMINENELIYKICIQAPLFNNNTIIIWNTTRHVNIFSKY